jgi:hypothetical protein
VLCEPLPRFFRRCRRSSTFVVRGAGLVASGAVAEVYVWFLIWCIRMGGIDSLYVSWGLVSFDLLLHFPRRRGLSWRHRMLCHAFFHLPRPLARLCLSSLRLRQLFGGSSERSGGGSDGGINRGIGCELARVVELVVGSLVEEARDGLFPGVELALGHRFELVAVTNRLGGFGQVGNELVFDGSELNPT